MGEKGDPLIIVPETEFSPYAKKNKRIKLCETLW